MTPVDESVCVGAPPDPASGLATPQHAGTSTIAAALGAVAGMATIAVSGSATLTVQ